MATRTWGGGTGPVDGLWSTATNWTGDTVPQAGDDVVFDATSAAACSVDVDIAAINSITITVSVTITVNAAQTTTFGAFAMSATGVFNSNGQSTITITSLNISTTTAYLVMGASNWSCSGNWTSSSQNLSYSFGTSTVTFTSNCSVSVVINAGHLYHIGFYNVVVNGGVTVSSTYFAFSGTLSGAGNLSNTIGFDFVPNVANPISLGGTLTLTTSNVVTNGTSTTDFSLPAISSAYFQHVAGRKCTMTGNISTTQYVYIGYHVNGGIDTGGFSITTGSYLQAGDTFVGYLICNNSTITVGTNFSNSGNAASYINFGTSTWLVSGNWTNVSTSASWSAGTATITFNGGAAQVLKLNDGNSANISYYNIVISNTGGTTITAGGDTAKTVCSNLFSITGNATHTLGGAVGTGPFSISAGNFTTSASNYNWTAGAVTVSGSAYISTNASAAITITSINISTTTAYLVMGSASWSVAGNWTSASTSASYDYGTSTVTFTSNATVTSVKEFYNLSINDIVTVSLTNKPLIIIGTLAIDGTTSGGISTGISTYLDIRGGLTIGTNGTFVSGNVIYVRGTNTLPASTHYPILYFMAGTRTLTGAITAQYIELFNAGGQGILNTAGFGVTVTGGGLGNIVLSGASTSMTCGASVISCVSMNISIASAYLVMNTSTWNVSGNWTNISNSASWSYDTSTVNFNGTGAQTLGLNNAPSANIGYYNITISNSLLANVTLGANTITVHGDLNISSNTCTVTEAANNPVWVISGDVTKATGSIWTRGTGLMTLNGNGVTVTDNGVVKTDLKDVTVTTAGVVNFTGCGMTTGTLHVTAGTAAVVDKVVAGTYTPAAGSHWTFVGGGTFTSAINTIILDAGTQLTSGDAPGSSGFAAKKIGRAGLWKW